MTRCQEKLDSALRNCVETQLKLRNTPRIVVSATFSFWILAISSVEFTSSLISKKCGAMRHVYSSLFPTNAPLKTPKKKWLKLTGA